LNCETVKKFPWKLFGRKNWAAVFFKVGNEKVNLSEKQGSYLSEKILEFHCKVQHQQ